MTTVALAGVLLAGTAVPAQADVPPPIRTCEYGTVLIPKKIRLDTCSDGLAKFFVWNRKTHLWRLVWQG